MLNIFQTFFVENRLEYQIQLLQSSSEYSLNNKVSLVFDIHFINYKLKNKIVSYLFLVECYRKSLDSVEKSNSKIF
jgi:hypothetical protein